MDRRSCQEEACVNRGEREIANVGLVKQRERELNCNANHTDPRILQFNPGEDRVNVWRTGGRGPKALLNLKPRIKPEIIAAEIEAVKGDKVPGIADIVKVLLSLSVARINAERSLDDFVRDVARSFNHRRERQSDRASFEARLKSLLSVEPLMLSARAFTVQHEYEHVFRTARIVTDIRPLFDHSGARLEGAMIVHNLKISFVHDTTQKEIWFALDDADISELKKILERAEIKSAALEKLVESVGVPYLESKQP